MGDVHQLNTSKTSQARLLEQWITQTISQHPNQAVAKRWAQLASRTATKFPGPPVPTQTELNLDDLQSLTPADKAHVMNELERFMSGYFDDVRNQLMQVHAELLALQKTVAELETGQE